MEGKKNHLFLHSMEATLMLPMLLLLLAQFRFSSSMCLFSQRTRNKSNTHKNDSTINKSNLIARQTAQFVCFSKIIPLVIHTEKQTASAFVCVCVCVNSPKSLQSGRWRTHERTQKEIRVNLQAIDRSISKNCSHCSETERIEMSMENHASVNRLMSELCEPPVGAIEHPNQVAAAAIRLHSHNEWVSRRVTTRCGCCLLTRTHTHSEIEWNAMLQMENVLNNAIIGNAHSNSSGKKYAQNV